MYKLLYILLFMGLIQSCQTDVVYSKYQTIPNASWKQNDVLEFNIPMKDSISKFNIYINLRNTKEYPYSNLFLVTQMTFPDKTKVIDTLEYEMTDAAGHFLGSGFSDIKENKLFYKEKVQFMDTGTYHFFVKQAMRKRNSIEGIDPLPGVSDVGISVEIAK